MKKDSVFSAYAFRNTLFVVLGKLAGARYKNIAVVHGNADLFAINGANFIF